MSASLTTKYLQIESVAQTFKTAKGDFPALRNIDLTVGKGEFVTLIGHSGCGKSTLLNLIAGLTMPTEGTLICANREIAGPGPERAVVFQNHSLLPWLTCFENVYLGVERVFGNNGRVDGKTKENVAQLKARTDAALDMVGLSHAAQKRPGEISGGMKQRVGIARALAMEPQVLLLDEPMAGMNVEEKQDMCRFILDVNDEFGCTIVLIEHDMGVVMDISDRVVVLDYGKKIGDGTPEEVRNNEEVISAYLGTSH